MLRHHITTHYTARHKQRGAALMVMLIIMVLGSVGFLVSSFNSSAIKIERDKKTAEVLAQAKEALIGRSAADTSLPGSLPCPNTTGDGVAAGAPDCPNYIGLLPWKTLGLPDLRDSTGAPLWYALSRNFRKDPTNNLINSDSLGSITVTGSPPAVNVVAIVFAPGANLVGQSRSDTQTATCSTLNGSVVTNNLCAANYLEGLNTNPSTATTPNIQYTSGAASSIFNDQMIYITSDQLLPIVEQRVAREAKICLDDYATTNANKYPWAADVADVNLYASTTNKTLGRLPKHQAADANVIAMMNAMNTLQSAVNNCKISNSPSNSNALDNAGSTFENASKIVKNNQPTTPAISTSVTTPALSAANYAQVSNKCTDILNNPSSNNVQQKLDSTRVALDSLNASFPWTINCSLFSSKYWKSWKDFLFYKIDSNFTPSSSGTGTPTLQINGAGNYRAVVLAARRAISPETHSIPTVISNYLEGTNQTGTSFTTYKPDVAGYQVINDLVLCLDGRVNCN